MFKKDLLMLISDYKIKLYDLQRKKSPLKLLKENNLDISDSEYALLNNILKNKNVYVIFDGEDFYVKLLKLPRVNLSKLKTIVKNEILLIFNGIDELTYTYKVFKRNKKAIDVVAVCINNDKNKAIKMISESCNVKKIYLIQLCYLKYIVRVVKKDNFLAVIIYNDHLYILAYLKENVIANCVLRNYKGNRYDFKNQLEHTIVRIEEVHTELCILKSHYEVYFINFKYNDIIKELMESCDCYDLGFIEEALIFRDSIKEV